ncbi:acetyl-CoA hydrolase/transferase family protein [Micrococcus sp. ACRRV]|uniref:acetyl-CoA hydrolase/transferase family protein n=1 Tax=Micrococcus sp. ACRRV TaxID=2918203 RepID=UPI001EF3BEAF|nr:acetyl-CoA hydrolase/transferase family protein [Micrococcus sp. ACRRV]MCG7421860.1 acetyl-CoA hydrolase/transferase family protein [Micrococcus sp. ACRRV]
MSSRIHHPGLRAKVMSAEEAAAFITPGMTVGMSGFTGSGYPKAVPIALAERIKAAHARGEDFRIDLHTGASTSVEMDGALAEADGVRLRTPFNTDPTMRAKINDGSVDYIDTHLSHLAQTVWEGFYGPMDAAVIEVSAIREDGTLVPSSSVGNNKSWLQLADKVILEVNSWQSEDLDGIHDVYYDTALPPHRKPVPVNHPSDRIGRTEFVVDLDKVVAVVETHGPDRNSPFKPADADSIAIAQHLVEFFEHEVKAGRYDEHLLPLQSGVGNVANAVMAELVKSRFHGLTAFTEVVQDGMLDALDSGTLAMASCTAFSLSTEVAERFNDNVLQYKDKLIIRTQEISNHPELVRRLGILAMNGMLEADLYGNVNSTHLMGTKMMNGLGGSGDFARNAFTSFFLTPSTAKGGDISCIVPMVSHVDHTEHDVHVVVTEQGLADLRGLSPKQRARTIIDTCAHPDYREQLRDYFDRAMRGSDGLHTPHLLGEALSWHQRFLETGTMRQG